MRADRFLVEQGYFATRAQAQAAIAAGKVSADGEPVRKASQKLGPDMAIMAEPAHPYVSRAALKLAGALAVFPVDPAGRTCLDIGASTGGFTQILLEGGARHVTAVDVGRGQLHASLIGREDVTSLEGQDARSLTAEMIGAAPDLLVCDASFISLEKLLPRPLGLAAPGADLIALIKPQFEVGRAAVGKGGVVRDEAARLRAVQQVRTFLEREGWSVQGLIDSPIEGGDGNKEYLVWGRKL